MNKTQTKKQPDLPTYLNYNRLIFHEDLWPDVVGRTLLIDFKRGELKLAESARPTMPTATITPSEIRSIIGDG